MSRGSSPLSAVSVGYVEALYDRFRADPNVVEDSWRTLFGILDLVGEATGADIAAGLANRGSDARSAALADAIRQWGHLSARVNPLAPAAALPDLPSFEPHLPPQARLPDVLRSLYCGSLAIETAHIDDARLRGWLIERRAAARVRLPLAAISRK